MHYEECPHFHFLPPPQSPLRCSPARGEQGGGAAWMRGLQGEVGWGTGSTHPSGGASGSDRLVVLRGQIGYLVFRRSRPRRSPFERDLAWHRTSSVRSAN